MIFFSASMNWNSHFPDSCPSLDTAIVLTRNEPRAQVTLGTFQGREKVAELQLAQLALSQLGLHSTSGLLQTPKQVFSLQRMSIFSFLLIRVNHRPICNVNWTTHYETRRPADIESLESLHRWFAPGTALDSRQAVFHHPHNVVPVAANSPMNGFRPVSIWNYKRNGTALPPSLARLFVSFQEDCTVWMSWPCSSPQWGALSLGL